MIALATTIVIHGLVLVCFFFLGLTHQYPPPPEYGIEVDLGGGGGGSYANHKVESAPKTSAAAEKLLTQESEETTTLPSSTVKTNTTKKTVATTTTQPTQDVVEEQVVNKNALFPGKRNTNNSNGQGTGNGTGNGSGSGTGTGSGSGGGIGNGDGDFYLDGRPVVRKAFPKSKNNLEGVVKVEFRADRDGNVVYAKAGIKGTTITDSQVWEECETAARQSKFKAKSDAQTEEKGVITYRFILQ